MDLTAGSPRAWICTSKRETRVAFVPGFGVFEMFQKNAHSKTNLLVEIERMNGYCSSVTKNLPLPF
jgi:hypothetical protein